MELRLLELCIQHVHVRTCTCICQADFRCFCTFSDSFSLISGLHKGTTNVPDFLWSYMTASTYMYTCTCTCTCVQSDIEAGCQLGVIHIAQVVEQ